MKGDTNQGQGGISTCNSAIAKKCVKVLSQQARRWVGIPQHLGSVVWRMIVAGQPGLSAL